MHALITARAPAAQYLAFKYSSSYSWLVLLITSRALLEKKLIRKKITTN